MDSQLFSIFTTTSRGLIFARVCLQLLMSGKSFGAFELKCISMDKLDTTDSDRHMPRGVEKGAKANKKKTFWHSLSFITGETIEASREFKKYVWIAHIHTTHTEVFSNCSLNLKHRPGIKLATETGERSQMKSWMNVGKHVHTHTPPPHEMRIDSANNENGQQLSHLTIINTLA